MNKQFLLGAVMGSALLFTASSALACGGAASGKHIGNVTAMNADDKTFTIRDMESRSPITFQANEDIMAALKDAKGTVMVNYEENSEGGLVAVGVTF